MRARTVLPLFAVCASLLAGLPAATAVEPPAGRQGWALVEDTFVDPPGLRLVDPRTGQDDELVAMPDTDPSTYDTQPAVWLDDHTIRRVRQDGGSSSSVIETVDLDTGEVEVEFRWDGPLSLSPDGRWAARSEEQQVIDGHRIVLRDLRYGQDVVPGTTPDRPRSPIAWSADSERLAFLEDRGDERVVRTLPLGVVAPVVTEVEGLRPESLALSPDGTQFAFPTSEPYGEFGERRGTMWVAPVVDGTVHPTPTDTGVLALEERTFAGAPSWRPDGSAVAAFVRFGGVQVVDLESGEVRAHEVSLSPDGYAAHLSWAPDGRHLMASVVENDSGCHCPVPGSAVLEADGGVTFGPEYGASGLGFAPGIVTRLSGRDRMLTSVEVSRHVHDTAEEAVLARADLYPDALAGGALATAVGGPLLLTPSDRLHHLVETELERLGVRRVHVLGSPEALGGSLTTTLRAMGIEVVRHGGADRFETATLVADALPSRSRTVHLVEGISADPSRGWPDAVSASALAAQEAAPLLLTRLDRLPVSTRDWLGANADTIDTVVVVGGPGAVADPVAREAAAAAGASLERIAGVNRYATSVAVARRAVDLGADPGEVWTASGGNWPDALVAGPATATSGGRFVLVPGASLDAADAAMEVIGSLDTSSRVHVAGGPDVVAPQVLMVVEAQASARSAEP